MAGSAKDLQMNVQALALELNNVYAQDPLNPAPVFFTLLEADAPNDRRLGKTYQVKHTHSPAPH